MKKILLVSMSAVLLFTSCGTYTGAGAVTGGSFGSIIGSAIGGIAGGRHGSNVGTLIGMAGGAAVGAAVGAAADNAQQRQYEDYQYNRSQRRTSSSSQRRYDYQDSYDSNGGGDDMALTSILHLPIRAQCSLLVLTLKSETLILLMRVETVCCAVASRPGWCLRSLITLPYLFIAYSLLWQK